MNVNVRMKSFIRIFGMIAGIFYTFIGCTLISAFAFGIPIALKLEALLPLLSHPIIAGVVGAYISDSMRDR